MTMADTFLFIHSHKNSYIQYGHQGSYAFKIKYYAHYYKMSNEEFEEAYIEAGRTFFHQAHFILKELGFEGFVIDGRLGGWLKPIDKNNKTINYPNDDFIDFEQYIVQEKIGLAFDLINSQFENIKKILEHSESLEQFNEYIREYTEL